MIPYYPLSPEMAHIVHFIFEWAGVMIGVQYYRILKKRHVPHQQGMFERKTFAVLIGCILGAGIGNKLLFVIENPLVWQQFGWVSLILGQTIVGGMLGGLIGVEIAKKIVGVRESTGDLFVLPLAVGLCVGRVGCYLAGLHDGTFGVATTLPWGIDFGDGVIRHPTQLYDIVAVLVFIIILQRYKQRLMVVAGLSFKLFLASYLAWRFWIDGLKPVPYAYTFGWSGIQWACVIALMLYLPFVLRDFWRLYERTKKI